MDTRDKKRVGDGEIFPFVLTEALLGEFVRRVAAFNEDGHALRADHIEALVRSRLEATEIPFFAELRDAPL